MKTPASTPISPVLLLLFLAAALADSPVATDARFAHSFQGQAVLLPRFHGPFFSPSFLRSRSQRNLFPLHARDRLHAVTRIHRQGSYMFPLERSRFDRLPSLGIKPPRVEKPDPRLPMIPQMLNLSNRRLPAGNVIPPECLNVLPLKAYSHRKQKFYPHVNFRKLLLKPPSTNPPPPAGRVICDMALTGMRWSGMELK